MASGGTGLVLLGLMALAACGGKDTSEGRDSRAAEAVAKATTGKDLDVKTDGQTVHIRGDGVKADLAATSEWPATMFPEVPRFDAATIVRVLSGEEGGMMKFNIFLRDAEAGSIERYVALLKHQGWKTSLMQMGPQAVMVSGEKDQIGMSLTYSYERKDGVFVAFKMTQ
jgi:hypothetical protein